jgi:hypothetical protein
MQSGPSIALRRRAFVWMNAEVAVATAPPAFRDREQRARSATKSRDAGDVTTVSDVAGLQHTRIIVESGNSSATFRQCFPNH